MKECPRCGRCYPDSVATCAPDDAVLTPSLEGPPRLDGKYDVQRRLGGGAMGVVYLARHRSLHRDVAIKLIKPTHRTAQFETRFRSEAAALGALKHPHIVDVTDFGVDPRGDGIAYLVLEYLKGVTLAHELRDGPMAVDDALPILTAIASAIDFAHERGVLHRDIKAENVFLVLDSSGRRQVKVLDFGVARIDNRLTTARLASRREGGVASEHPVSATPDEIAATVGYAAARSQLVSNSDSTTTVTLNVTAPYGIVGTLPYLAPELFDGERASRASDLYAFGVVAYETLVGKRPFLVSSVATARRVLQGEPPPAHQENRALDAEISAALASALNRSASARPRSAGEFVGALRYARYEAKCREWNQTEVPRRRRLAAFLAVLLAAAAWLTDRTGIARSFEQRLVDAQFHVAPKSAPDPRLVVVLLDDISLARDQTVLGERADEFADRLERIFAAGASGVAIDFLLPQRWSTSSLFSRFVLTHADHLALAAMSARDGVVVGPEVLTGLTAAALGPQLSSQVFGFVNLEPDTDGVVRHGRLFFPDVTESVRDSFPVRAIRAGLGEGALMGGLGRRRADARSATFRIDASVDRARIPVLRWNEVPEKVTQEPAFFRNRLVLVGGDFLGSGDVHWLSGADELAPGVMLQAVIAHTILKALPVRESGIALWLPVIAFCAWIAAEHILPTAHFKLPVWTLALMTGWVVASMAAFLTIRLVTPILLPVATVATTAGIATAMRPLLRPFPTVES
jgi:serine/threonine protein kinase